MSYDQIIAYAVQLVLAGRCDTLVQAVEHLKAADEKAREVFK